LALAVAYDSARRVTLRMSPDQPIRAGAASNLVMDGPTLRWTQDWSGAACQARAVLTPATPLVPETMEGTLACEHGEMTFILRKKTG
jgi:hypothetical protein